MTAERYSRMQLLTMSALEVEREVRKHNRLYWDEHKPEISDYEYDRLVERLRELKPASKLLTDFGAARFGSPVTHETPMLSLDKCYSDEELLSWAAKLDGDVVVTPKVDGIACSLRYDAAGNLVVAATRGNGAVGDDITLNARTIADIPRELRGGPLEIRGEIYMRLSVFAGYKDEFSNPRNLAAGAIKHKDPQRCAAYGLSFMAYDLLGVALGSERQKLAHLVKLGFPPTEHRVAARSELQAAYAHFAARRDQLDFEIDGVVFKADLVAEQQRLGATAHHPRYGMAYKFQGDSGTTVLEGVEWSVARTGAITPVALVKPVTLSGASVSRASLHHAGFIEKLKLTLGAQVVVTRRGGVIPNVELVAQPGDRPVEIPQRCPSCDKPVRQENDFLYCTEPASCRKAVIGTIAHFCKVVDIQGFGDKILAEAYDAEVLRSPADLFALTAAELLPLERVGDELARKLVANVAAHRRIELPTFLRALGVDALGQHVAGILAERFGTLAAIRHVTGPELAAIHSIGPTIATSVVSGLAAKAPLIDALLAQVAVAEAGAERTAGPLAGQSFVFTGKLLAFERAVAQKKVISLGGAAPSGVTKTLTYLVVGDGKEESKSSKQLKAEKYIAEGAALRVITEREFLALVGEI